MRSLASRFAVLSLWCVAATGLLSLSVPVRAAEFDPEVLAKIPAAMQKYVDQKVVSGVVAVVGSSKGIASISAVGQQSLEPAVKMSEGTLFRIASMTKPITALAVMQQVEQGKVKVDDPVANYLPEFRGQLLVAERGAGTVLLKKPSRPITVRDLMTHTSGLPSGFPEGIADLYTTRKLSLAEAVMVSSQRPLDFEPGSKWSYCNAGIDTLGRIVEVVSGETYEDYLARHIFEPLSMKDTVVYVRSDQKSRLVTLYAQKDGALVTVEKPLLGPTEGARHPIPAGGLISTASDMARFYQCCLLGGELEGKRIITAETLAEMTKTQTGDLPCGFVTGMSFGYGFAVVKEPQGITELLSKGTYGHGGAYGTQGWVDPGHDLFIVLMIQRANLPNADASDLRRDLQTLAIQALMK